MPLSEPSCGSVQASEASQMRGVCSAVERARSQECGKPVERAVITKYAT